VHRLLPAGLPAQQATTGPPRTGVLGVSAETSVRRGSAATAVSCESAASSVSSVLSGSGSG